MHISSTSLFLSLVALSAVVVVGCGSSPQGQSDVEKTDLALDTPSAAAPSIPVAPPGREHYGIDPQPAPPTPIDPPPGCFQVTPCVVGLTFDTTPGICRCVEASDAAPPAPTMCLQLSLCMTDTHFDDTNGVCACVPNG